MAYYFLYNSTSGQILAVNTSGLTPGTGEAVLQLPLTDPTAILAAAHPAWYLVQGSPPVLVLQPYWTATVSVTSTSNEYEVTAVLNNSPSTPPTSAMFTVLGSAYSEAVSSGMATFTLAVHPSCVDFPVTVTASASGTVAGSVTFGGSQVPPVQLQCVPLTGGTVPTVTPTGPGSESFLQAFYAQKVDVAHQPGDIATADAIAFDTLFGSDGILAALIKAGTWTPTSAQSGAITYIQQTIEPTLPVTLAGVLNSSGEPVQPVAQYASDLATAAQAFAAYAHDLQSIPGLA